MHPQVPTACCHRAKAKVSSWCSSAYSVPWSRPRHPGLEESKDPDPGRLGPKLSCSVISLMLTFHHLEYGGKDHGVKLMRQSERL